MSKNTVFVAIISALCLAGAATVVGADKAPKKLTCCETAAEKKKECAHKCCVMAHNRKESCVKCNPGKEDLKLAKKAKEEKKGTLQTAR